MWCKLCQQDVRGVTDPDLGHYCCPRCGSRFDAEGDTFAEMADPSDLPIDDPFDDPSDDVAAEPADDLAAELEATLDSVGAERPPGIDAWEMDEDLEHIHRVLAPDAGDGEPRRGTTESGRYFRVDAAHQGPEPWHKPLTRKLAALRSPQPRKPEPLLPLVTWGVLSLGLMAIVCGGVLLGWSVISGRDNLWSIGMPIALGGQVVLLLGFILQLDRLWHDSRSTANKLDTFDERLADLKTTTSLLGTTHSTPAVSFYSHMAGGANPQLLLADLKSQLDLLALKLSQEER